MVTIRSQNFEAIRGHDHMRLDSNFAELVIRKIMKQRDWFLFQIK